MAVVIQELINQYNAFMAAVDPRTVDMPLVRSPLPILAIMLSYAYFSTRIGPAIMRNVPAYDCKTAMIIYNIVQIILNGYIFLLSIFVIWIPMRHSLICQEVDYSNDPIALRMTRAAYLYFISKILDIMDTVFMVLRKKDNQISFLHVYHHTGMILGSWIAVRVVPGGALVFIGTLNTFVHVVMYSYYLLTALSPEYKKSIWWKRHITELQMIQFAMTIVHGTVHVLNSSCNFPKIVGLIYVPQDIFMFFMFWDFYKKAYLTTPKKNE